MINNKKAEVGWLFSLIIVISLILILFLGVYLGLSSIFENKSDEVKAKTTNYETQQQMLSLFTVPIIRDLLSDRTPRFKEAVKSVYGKDARCKLTIDGIEKDIGCQKIKKIPQKIELTFPRNYGEDAKITFEVVS